MTHAVVWLTLPVVVLVFLTRFEAVTPEVALWIGGGATGGVLVAGILSVVLHWPSPAAVLVRLEGAYRLHNQLSAANEGKVSWPPPPEDWRPLREIFRWQVRTPVLVALAAVLLTLFALFLPLPKAASPQVAYTQKPPALARLEEIVISLEASKMVDQRQLEMLVQQVQELGDRSPESWYSHAALEAAESLLERTEKGLTELQGNFSLAARSFDESEASGAGNSTDVASPQSLHAALRGFERALFPAAEALMQMMQEASENRLSPEQLAQLADKLRDHAGVSNQLAQNGQTVEKFFQQAAFGSTPGNPYGFQTWGQGPGEPSQEGTGPTPLLLAQHPSTAETGTQGVLGSMNPNRAALGDIVSQASGQHEIDRLTAEQGAEGGSVNAPGSGGEAVWNQRLTPAERRAVQRAFQSN